MASLVGRGFDLFRASAQRYPPGAQWDPHSCSSLTTLSSPMVFFLFFRCHEDVDAEFCIAISFSSRFSLVFSLTGFPVTRYHFLSCLRKITGSYWTFDHTTSKRNSKLVRSASQIVQGSPDQSPVSLYLMRYDTRVVHVCRFNPRYLPFNSSKGTLA